MSDFEKVKKTLGIKIKTIERIRKDKISYEREDAEIRARLDKMKSDDLDPLLIRKQEEVLQENSMMLPDCNRRLTKAFQDLQDFLETNRELICETEEFETASGIVAEWQK